MFKRAFSIVMLISVIVIAGFGMYTSAKSDDGHTISNCLYHVASVAGSMKLGEHIEGWRSSVTGTISFELPLLFSFLLFILLGLTFISFDFWKIKLVQLILNIRGKPPKLLNYFNLIFASGVLHPKIF